MSIIHYKGRSSLSLDNISDNNPDEINKCSEMNNENPDDSSFFVDHQIVHSKEEENGRLQYEPIRVEHLNEREAPLQVNY